MKYILLIFALLIACRDEDNQLPCKSVARQFSDANPVQFWSVDCLTYNENEVCGIHPKCWCHPWECDDEIPVQFTSTDDDDYLLNIYNESDSLIDSLEFSNEIVRSGSQFLNFSNTNFLTGIQYWNNFPGSNRASAQTFAWEDLPVGTDNAICDATGSGYENSQYFASENIIDGLGFWPIGDYVIQVKGWNQSIGTPDAVGIGLWGMNNSTSQTTLSATGTATLPIGGALTTRILSFTLTQEYKYIALSLTRLGGGGAFDILCHLTEINMLSAPGVFVSNVHNASITPSLGSPSICNEKIRLEIYNSTDSAIEYKSDCLDIRDSHDCTTLIEYSNNRNFAGLIYQNVSPEQTFNIRVPAIFFHEQFPEEDEAMELTTGIQKTSGTLKVQRLFDTDYMPYYMHKKLQLIFKHQFITIDGLSWLKEEKYEIQQGERRWPLKKAKCFLTQDYIQRAVL